MDVGIWDVGQFKRHRDYVTCLWLWSSAVRLRGKSSLVYIKTLVCITTHGDLVTANVCVPVWMRSKTRSTIVTRDTKDPNMSLVTCVGANSDTVKIKMNHQQGRKSVELDFLFHLPLQKPICLSPQHRQGLCFARRSLETIDVGMSHMR